MLQHRARAGNAGYTLREHDDTVRANFDGGCRKQSRSRSEIVRWGKVVKRSGALVDEANFYECRLHYSCRRGNEPN